MSRRRLLRGLVVLGGLAALWTIVVMWTGGGVWSFGGVRISSHGPRNPALLIALSVVLAWAIAAPGQRTHALAVEYQWLIGRLTRRVPRIPSLAPVAALLAAVIVAIVGLTEGAGVVGGSDSYGYVSQAHLWTLGVLRQRPVLANALANDVSLEVLAPLGYRPSVDGTTIAPTYPPGLPMVMAVFEKLTGPESVFGVVPILAAVLVWTTYLLGARLHSPPVGAIAAMLVATSPPVLVQLTAAPLSDVPAAAWWMLAMVLATIDRRIGAFGAGAAAGIAILTRPNLAPLAAIVLSLLIWRLTAAGRSRGHVIQDVTLFSLPAASACLVIAAIDDVLWGSPLTSGHGPLSTMFSVSNLWSNVVLYPSVFVQRMPVVLALPVAWLVERRAGHWRLSTDSDRPLLVALGGFAIVAVLAYIAYPAYDSSSSLRFLIPAVPAVIVLASLAAFSLAGRLLETGVPAGLIALVALGGYGVHTARTLGAFDMEHLRRYAVIGRYVDRELPEDAVLLAMLHSGTATYYSGAPTVRYDLLPPAQLDSLVDTLKQRGYQPYLLLDTDERLAFQDRFRGHSRLAALDWQPLVRLRPPPVEIYSVRAEVTPQP